MKNKLLFATPFLAVALLWFVGLKFGPSYVLGIICGAGIAAVSAAAGILLIEVFGD